MPRIDILPDGTETEASEQETILQALLRSGVPHAHVCGGKARCSTCRFLVLEGLENCSPPTPKEQRIASRLHFPPDIRLACQTHISGPIKIRRLIIDDEDIEFNSLFSPDNLAAVVGVEKGIIILFADIQGFTAFAETLMPYDVVHVLNRFFNLMGKVIRHHKGYINAYMGDGLMALFETEDPAATAQQAIRAGLAMLTEVEKMRPYLQELYQRSFNIRIGLHYGQVVTGALGALGDRKETVIGDAVNVASRIEAANKEAGTRFLVSEVIYRLVQDKVLLGKSLEINLPGKSQIHNLYEVVGISEDPEAGGSPKTGGVSSD
jgi:adenylate cyclase